MKSSPECVCMHKSRAFITLHRLSREENEIKGEVRVDPSQGVHGVHLPLLPDCYPARPRVYCLHLRLHSEHEGIHPENCFCRGEGVVAVIKR